MQLQTFLKIRFQTLIFLKPLKFSYGTVIASLITYSILVINVSVQYHLTF